MALSPFGTWRQDRVVGEDIIFEAPFAVKIEIASAWLITDSAQGYLGIIVERADGGSGFAVSLTPVTEPEGVMIQDFHLSPGERLVFRYYRGTAAARYGALVKYEVA